MTPIITGLAEQNGLKKNLGHLWQNECSQKFLFVLKVAGRAGAKCQKAARAVFVSLFIQKQLIYDFLAGNNYPDSPPSKGGMKFATQISPLLNLKCNNHLNSSLHCNKQHLLPSMLSHLIIGE